MAIARKEYQVDRNGVHQLYRQFVNPDFVELLESFDYGRYFVRAEGTKLYDDTGREYLDFLAGFGVHNIGHNHPRLLKALHAALDSHAPSMLNVDAPLSMALLAQKLSDLTHAELCRTAFANSGTEAVEMAMRTVRAATGRQAIIACAGAYHGLTMGSLSLMGSEDIRQPFGPLLDKVTRVAFGDVDALQDACVRYQPAGFFVEPIQAEGGIRIPVTEYLQKAAQICKKHGCLLVVDEIQTGLARTGTLFATDFHALVPDILLVGKALSAGLIPVAATITSAKVWHKAFGGPARCVLTKSTFAGGHLAMMTGLETLAVIQEERLAEQATHSGQVLLALLKKLAEKHEIISDVRGKGLLLGIEFKPPAGLLMKAVPKWAREGLYAQVICALLVRDHAVLTQPCTIKPNVLRLEPPLMLSNADIEKFTAALDQAIASCPTQGTALGAAFKKYVLHEEL